MCYEALLDIICQYIVINQHQASEALLRLQVVQKLTEELLCCSRYLTVYAKMGYAVIFLIHTCIIVGNDIVFFTFVQCAITSLVKD
jgi:hypothetical protein